MNMKSVLIAFSLLVAAPALAQTAPAALEKKGCCCDKMAEKKMDCCDKAKGNAGGSNDAHAGHGMSGAKSQ